jgi:hypothetical protein
MPDDPCDDHKIEAISDLAGLFQHSKHCKNGLSTRTRGVFENWLMEYHNRLAKVIDGETKEQETVENP